MKNLLNQVSNGNAIAKFQNLELSKVAQQQLKGGEDVIIVEASDG